MARRKPILVAGGGLGGLTTALALSRHGLPTRSMDHFAGLDVSVKETSVCIVDDTGKIVRQALLKAQINKTDRNGARHGADDAGGALPPRACQDTTQSETADVADPSPTASVEGDRH